MDDLSFGLSEPARILRATGVRHLFPVNPSTPGDNANPGVSALASQPVDCASLLLEDPWPGFLAKVPPNPRSLWTYWDLGADFSGASDPRRANMLRRLLGALELPKGFVGFWPCTVLEQSGLGGRPQAFLAGLHRIRPVSLVVFGPDCFARLFASTPTALADVSREVALYDAPDIMAVLDFDDGQMDMFLRDLSNFYASLLSRA